MKYEGGSSLDAHCPVALFQAEPVTIVREGVTLLRLSFNLRELQSPRRGSSSRRASTLCASTASTHRPPFPSDCRPSGRALSSRVRLVRRANARHELNSISIIARALHNRGVLIPIPATTDSRHSRSSIERHGLHLHADLDSVIQVCVDRVPTRHLPPPTFASIPSDFCLPRSIVSLWIIGGPVIKVKRNARYIDPGLPVVQHIPFFFPFGVISIFRIKGIRTVERNEKLR